MKENIRQGTMTELTWKTTESFECFVSLHQLLCLFRCFSILTITHSSLVCQSPDGCTYFQWYGHFLSFNFGHLYTFSSFVSGLSPSFKVCNWWEGVALKACKIKFIQLEREHFKDKYSKSLIFKLCLLLKVCIHSQKNVQLKCQNPEWREKGLLKDCIAFWPFFKFFWTSEIWILIWKVK